MSSYFWLSLYLRKRLGKKLISKSLIEKKSPKAQVNNEKGENEIIFSPIEPTKVKGCTVKSHRNGGGLIRV